MLGSSENSQEPLLGESEGRSCGICQGCVLDQLMNDLLSWRSGLLLSFDLKLANMTLLFLSEVGPSRTLLWAWRGVENRHFISTLWDKQAQIRIWTSSPGHSLFELEGGSNSRKHLVLTAVNTTVAGCALSDANPWSWDLSSLSAWRLSFSPVLDLLLPVSCVFFFLSFFFF